MRPVDHHDSFEALYNKQYNAMKAYCQRRLPADEVDDALSEIFTVAWRRYETVQATTDTRLWLYGVARNTLRNMNRSRRRRSRLSARAAAANAQHEESHEQRVVAELDSEVVLSALQRLNQTDQEILRLHTWEDLSRRELSDVYGISPKAVDMRIKRATKRMARALRESAGDQLFGELS